MVDRIGLDNIGIKQIQPVGTSVNNLDANKGGTASFSDTLKQAIEQVNQLDVQSSKMGELLASGQLEHLHEASIISAKASTMLELTVQVRNKAVEAYQEIMRMQV